MSDWLTDEEAKEKRQTDIGPPHFEKFLPPVIKKNYGDWAYHEELDGGTMVHVANSGDKVYTVRVASPRILSTETIREMLDIADAHCDGYIRWTTRNNVEFMTPDEGKVEPLAASGAESRTRSTPRAGCTATAPAPTPLVS
jgi:sulfite reductase beta subunit